MASVYVLYSKEIDHYYTGSCKSFEGRFGEHISKCYPKSFTTRADDWGLFLHIDNLTFKQARGIEMHIKKMKSRTYIQNLVKYPNIIEKLKVKYS